MFKSGLTPWAFTFILLSALGSDVTRAQIFCTADDQCDDGFACTNDGCNIPTNTCVFSQDDDNCDDGFACTSDGCQPGHARADAEGCVYSQVDENCDDGFACTNDGCQPGHARADAEGCVYSQVDENCDDGFACTHDGCQPGNDSADSEGCIHSLDDTLCEDFNDCTEDGCQPSNINADLNGCIFPVLDTSGCCDEDSDCDDGFDCTIDSCNTTTNECEVSPGVCDDGFSCTDDECDPNDSDADADGCVFTPGDCDDGFSCTDDECDPTDGNADADGCVFTPGNDCDDDATCTTDACDPTSANADADGCVFSPTGTCDDGFSCTDDVCDPPNSTEPGTGCTYTGVDSRCDDGMACNNPDTCDPTNPARDADGCVFGDVIGCCSTVEDCPPDPDPCTRSVCDVQFSVCRFQAIPDCRVSATQKGSFLAWSKVELRWGASGDLTQDTILELTNDNNLPVCVQLYLVVGDEPLDPILAGDPPMVVAEGEPGWVWVDCSFCLTHDQPIYWSAARGAIGEHGGCQPLTTLDPDTGSGPGRPDPDIPGSRILRGFVYGWAVDNTGAQIRWDHLTGSATLVNYLNSDAWEYNAWAFQGRGTVPQGSRLGAPGRISFDGVNYQAGFDRLLMEFFEPGSQALSADGGPIATVDMDLTLHPLTADLRQDSIGPITTKAHFDIWDENERGYSGTTRCITCWDQTLLSQYESPNNFVALVQTDKGKARIDGMRSDVCDVNCIRPTMVRDQTTLNLDFLFDILGIDHVCSFDVPILGVVAKVLAFSGGASGTATAGRNLVGQGSQAGWVQYDIISGPGTLQGDENVGLRSSRGTGKGKSRDSATPIGLPTEPSR